MGPSNSSHDRLQAEGRTNVSQRSAQPRRHLLGGYLYLRRRFLSSTTVPDNTVTRLGQAHQTQIAQRFEGLLHQQSTERKPAPRAPTTGSTRERGFQFSGSPSFKVFSLTFFVLKFERPAQTVEQLQIGRHFKFARSPNFRKKSSSLDF